MKIKEMVAAVQAQTGTSQRKARQLVSDGAERLDLACEGEDEYTDEDVVEMAVQCWNDENEE